MRRPRKMWKKLGYLTVPKAGKQAYWGRAESYRQARLGNIPVEKDGSFLWVPPDAWAKRLSEMQK